MRFTTIDGRTIETHQPTLLVYENVPGGPGKRYQVEIWRDCQPAETWEVSKDEFDRLHRLKSGFIQ